MSGAARNYDFVGCTYDTLRELVGRTDLLSEQPAMDDIIGVRSSCLAEELQALPEIFLRKTFGYCDWKQAAQFYEESFTPHIALELRWGIMRDFDEILRAAQPQRPSPNRGHIAHKSNGPNNGVHDSNSVPNAIDSNETEADRDMRLLRDAFPLSPWVARASNATTVKAVGRPLSVRLTNDKRPFNLGLDKGGQFARDDIVLALLPLSTLLPAWLAHTQLQLRSGLEVAGPTTAGELIAAVPQAWRDLGCFPQVCYVSDIPDKRTHSMVRATISTGWVRREQRGAKSAKVGVLPAGTSDLSVHMSFWNAVAVGFIDPDKPFLLADLGSMQQSFECIRALGLVAHRRKIADTLYDPCASAMVSGAYFDRIRDLLGLPAAMAHARARLLQGDRLNDWQTKAIGAVLYAVAPTWADGLALVPSGRAAASDGPGCPPELLVIEGPPGTGKTQTIATLILNLVHHLPRGSHVLLCAPSNCAIDEAFMRTFLLVKKQFGGAKADGKPQLLRVGRREKTDLDVLRLWPLAHIDDRIDFYRKTGRFESGSVERKGAGHVGRGQGGSNNGGRGAGHGGRGGQQCAGSHSRLSSRSNQEVWADKVQQVAAADVTFSTLGSLNQIRRMCSEAGSSYDVVIIDEASQATEPDVVQALMLAKRRCILVGDSKQLQPTILCDEAARHGLKRSLLVRLLTNGHKSFGLLTQYRMHPDICHFPNHRYYDGDLLTGASVLERQELPAASPAAAAHRNLTLPQKLCGKARLAFVNVPKGHMLRSGTHTLSNPREAEAVAAYLEQLRTFLGISVAEFGKRAGVITFYKGQEDAIRKSLSQAMCKSGLQVATVDSFQGKEKDIVLISCVRTADDATLAQLCGNAADKRSLADIGRNILGFLISPHRLNVALTRAKDLCIVFGHQPTLAAVGTVAAARVTVEAAPPPCSAYPSGACPTTVDSSAEAVMAKLCRDDADPTALAALLTHVA